MSLLLGKMSHFIPGRKDLTEHKELLRLSPEDTIYIPLPAAGYQLLVQEGDEVCIGTKLAETVKGFYVPVYASVSGIVKGVQKRMSASLKPVDHIVIENDKKMTKKAPLSPLEYRVASREEIVERIKEAGIVGLGGAGFPTYVKYQKPEGVNCVLINAVECEPFITSDYRTLMDDAAHFVMGCEILKKAAAVDIVHIAIKKSHPDLISVVQDALHGTQGIDVVPVKDVYPMGWERVLVREILHKEYDRLPAEAGAIVSNATTAIAVAYAFEKGEPITEKTVTVSGPCIAEPKNVHCVVGAPVSSLIKACGGCTEQNVRLVAGGPMMGKTIVNDMFVVDRTTNAVTILPDPKDDNIACLRCGRCSDHCPAGLQPVRIANALKLNNVEEMEKRGAMQCIECGLCTYVCPSHIDVTENVRRAKRTLSMRKQGGAH